MTKSNIRNQNELDDELWGEIPPDPIYSHGLSSSLTAFIWAGVTPQQPPTICAPSEIHCLARLAYDRRPIELSSKSVLA